MFDMLKRWSSTSIYSSRGPDLLLEIYWPGSTCSRGYLVVAEPVSMLFAWSVILGKDFVFVWKLKLLVFNHGCLIRLMSDAVKSQVLAQQQQQKWCVLFADLWLCKMDEDKPDSILREAHIPGADFSITTAWCSESQSWSCRQAIAVARRLPVVLAQVMHVICRSLTL